MFIREIDIENFRCFDKFHVDFDRSCNVVIGSNGAGKSAFLETVAAAVSAYLTGFDGQSYFHVCKSDIRKNRRLINQVIDEQYSLPLRISASGVIAGQEFPEDEWTLELRNSAGRTSHRGIQKITGYVSGIQDAVRKGNADIILPVISYYSKARLWKTKEKRRSAEHKSFMRQNGYLDCMAVETDIEKLFHYLRTRTLYKVQTGNNPVDLVCVLNAIRESITDEFISGKLREVWFNLSEDSLEFTLEDGTVLPYSYFSDGFKVVIGLVADIAYRMSVLNPNLGEKVLSETPGVVIIDEIDLHLHPRWQSEIMGILTRIFPSVQFIVSSHSPSVISSVKKENIIELKYGEPVPVKQEYEVYGNDASTILKAVMNAGERPARVTEMFREAESFLDNGEYEKCRVVLGKIASEIGEYDSELNRLRMELEFESSQI